LFATLSWFFNDVGSGYILNEAEGKFEKIKHYVIDIGDPLVLYKVYDEKNLEAFDFPQSFD